jgi:hypothetical protein
MTPAAVGAAASGGEPLLELLAECVVRIDRDGRFVGTGFFVAPGRVLTCAHVAHGGLPLAVTTHDGVTLTAEPVTVLLAPDDPAARFYPQPDAALLAVEGADPGQPCVRLEQADPVGSDGLQLTAYTLGEYAPGVVVRSGAALGLDSSFELEGWSLYKLREGQVLGGFSGGPLLNRRTGSVCALVDSSRSTSSDLGGFGVPTAAIATVAPGLLADNAAFHAADERWAQAVRAQATLAAERAGRRDELPVLSPVRELEWAPGDPASDLLRPRYAVVPFIPRGDLGEQVMRWRESGPGLRVLVLTGAGGFGKTRTAAELCRAAEQAGWVAGPLDTDPGNPAGGAGEVGLSALAAWPGRLMVVVDYAETRPELVTGLLKRLLRRRDGSACRVVLVVRQGGSRAQITELFATGTARDDLVPLFRRAEFAGLGRGERELDRTTLFDTAAAAFGTRFGRPAPTGRPDLRGEVFERPLLVLAAALLIVSDPDVDVAGLDEVALLGEVLDRHEAVYWERTNQRRQLGLDPEDQKTAVALAVLGGLGTFTEDDQRLVRLVPSLSDASNERVTAVLRWLKALYGPHGSLEPDLLGEVHLARVITAAPALVASVLEAASDAQLGRTLVVLSRVADRSTAAREVVRDAVDDRLTDLVQRVGTDEDLVTALRLAIAASEPGYGAIDAQYGVQSYTVATGRLALEIGQLAVGGLRAVVASSDADQDADSGRAVAAKAKPLLAAALSMIATTYGELGHPGEALAPIEEAVNIRRDLAEADPARFLPHLASSLNNQSNRLGEAGRRGDALAPIEEAVGLYRRLAQADPDGFLPDLASSLNNQSNHLAEAGRPRDALAPI